MYIICSLSFISVLLLFSSFQSFKESVLFLTVLSWLFSLNLFFLLEYKFSHDLLE